MATYPYTSGQGAVTAAFAQLRSNFPSKVDSGYLQRFSIASSNESYVIGILRFIGVIDDDGGPVEEKTSIFYGDDETFHAGLTDALRVAYSQLFGEMGDDAFTADKNALTRWFRAADRTSELVGQRQASTFQTLAALAGHGEPPNAPVKKTASMPTKKTVAKKVPAKKAAQPAAAVVNPPAQTVSEGATTSVGLTVRIEVNLPAGGDATTYDNIFASIKKHLMP